MCWHTCYPCLRSIQSAQKKERLSKAALCFQVVFCFKPSKLLRKQLTYLHSIGSIRSQLRQGLFHHVHVLRASGVFGVGLQVLHGRTALAVLHALQPPVTVLRPVFG